MLSPAERQRIAINIWTARVVPVVLAGVVGYATYVLVVPLCAHYLISRYNDIAAAIIILVVYFLLFLLMAASLLRLVYLTIVDPPYLPLGAAALRDARMYDTTEKEKPKADADGIGGAEYMQNMNRVLGTKDDPDSPGLELFYTKDVFVCETDGRPKWCSHCANWKPDRTHHCSDSGRCILKMDHFCPWVGGPVGENNFKFFIQYTFWTALYCLHLLVVMAVYIARQVKTEGETYNSQFTAILGIATFFFLFTAGMTGTSVDLAMNNLTQVERLGSKTRVQTLAVLKPSRDELYRISPFLASQQPYREITYPIATNEQPISTDKSNTSSVISHPSSTTPASEPTEQAAGSEPQPSHSNSALEAPSVPVQNGLLIPATDVDRLHLASRPVEHQLAVPASANGSIPPGSSNRDLKATRTFAVLNMKQGDNPWDLGTRLLNWETVMGSNIFDWFLPIRRSPCCNHEDAESQFQIGPWVDLLRSSVGFLHPKDMRAYGGRRKLERRTSEDLRHGDGRKAHRSRRRRRMNLPSPEAGNPVPLDDLERQAPQYDSG
ncbi:related to PFA3 Palmitoyltransferase for Vac8p, required for vacuolar integrity under stress conditions [Phialocephala subalpina]|uniref:Palmitoyltransferase n=1 Tax=Phialocephala subalpina TaxID=576137 RepID=A0A1L7XCT0_9HELO|nr:related to PFA3 Palmitoyltransferase for Vac8p, required for vacuolar integrity under stress conditions [Phialocephala subalpina]